MGKNKNGRVTTCTLVVILILTICVGVLSCCIVPYPIDELKGNNVVVEATYILHTGEELHTVGSGVIIDANGIIITALHVVDGSISARVIFDDGTIVPVVCAFFDPNHDIAILKVNHKSDTCANIDFMGILNDGDNLVSVGTPMGVYDDVISKGKILKLQLYRLWFDPEVPYIMTDIVVYGGCSGGGVYYKDMLIGIMCNGLGQEASFIFPIYDRDILDLSGLMEYNYEDGILICP